MSFSKEETEALQRMDEEKRLLLQEKLKLEKQELSTKIESLVYLKAQISKQNSGRIILQKIEALIEQLIDDPQTRLDIPTLLRIHESFTQAENQAAMGIFSVLKQQVMVQQNNVNVAGKDLPKLVLNKAAESIDGVQAETKKEKLATAKNFIDFIDELEETEFSPEEREVRSKDAESPADIEIKPTSSQDVEEPQEESPKS